MLVAYQASMLRARSVYTGFGGRADGVSALWRVLAGNYGVTSGDVVGCPLAGA